MTVQLNDSMNMGGCLTEIARGNEMKSYVNGPLLGSTNPFDFLHLPLLQLHTGMVLIMTPLICPQPTRALSITFWKEVQTRPPD
jgi:hypothetical protein